MGGGQAGRSNRKCCARHLSRARLLRLTWTGGFVRGRVHGSRPQPKLQRQPHSPNKKPPLLINSAGLTLGMSASRKS